MKPTTRTLLPLAGAALAYSLAQTLVVPALPTIQHDLHTTNTCDDLGLHRVPAHVGRGHPPPRQAR